MKRILLSLVALVWLSLPGWTQSPPTMKLCFGNPCVLVTSGNPLPVSGTFSASIAGFPTIQSTGTPISVTTGGVTGTLPTGTVVVASNVGATNGAFCKLGASSTTSDQLIPPNSWFAFTVGANTQLTCITSASTTTVNMVGGSGLPTGSGGGGSGGGSGLSVTDQAAFTQGTSPFAPGGGVFNDTATLTSGQQGTYRLTTKRAQIVDTDTTGNALYSAVTAPVPCQAQATWSTNTGLTGTQAARCDGSAALWYDIGAVAGTAVPKQGIGVANGGSFYQAVAASATATVLQSSTGAAGDYLSHCVLYPTSTSPGVVTVFDNTNAAGTSAILFPGGSSSLSNLAPIAIPVGAVSTAGAWKVTTGTAISVVCYGKFS